MSFSSARQDIAELFDDWTATDVLWEDLEDEVPEQDEWLMVHVLFNSSSPFTLDDGKMRTGILQVDVFTRRNTGTKRERELIDSLSTLLEGKVVNGLLIRSLNIDVKDYMDAWRKVVTSFEFEWLEN